MLHYSNLQEFNHSPVSANVIKAEFQLTLQHWHLEASAKRQLSSVEENEHLQQLLKKATIWWLTYIQPLMVQIQPEPVTNRLSENEMFISSRNKKEKSKKRFNISCHLGLFPEHCWSAIVQGISCDWCACVCCKLTYIVNAINPTGINTWIMLLLLKCTC